MAALLLMAVLVAPVGLPVRAIAATIVVVFTRRPQAALLAGIVAIPVAGDNSTVVVLTIVSCGLGATMARGRGVGRGGRSMVCLLGLLACWSMASYALFREPLNLGGPSPTDLLQLVAGVLITAYAAYYPPTPWNIGLTAMIGVAVIGAIALVAPLGGDDRLAVLGLNPNYTAALLALLLAGTLLVRGRGLMLLHMAVWPIGVAALLRTQSRGGIVALIAVVSIWILLKVSERTRAPRSRRWAVLSCAVALGVGGQFALSTADNVFSARASEGYASSDSERAAVLGAAGDIMLRGGLLGVGFGNFSAAAAGDPELHEYVNSHNEYVGLVVELGLGGLVVFVVPVAWALWRSRLVCRMGIPALGSFVISLLLGNELNNLGTAYLFWLLIGLGLGSGMVRQADREYVSGHMERAIQRRT